jgi:LmbE family N-acetylglucosaminyl deacetylase
MNPPNRLSKPSGLLRLWAMGLVASLGILAGMRMGAAVEPMSGPEILQQLNSFQEMGSVLMVGAHPDDEHTILIAYLARGKNYRTAYLSVTRGDGGQNVLGPEFGEELGVARTQELLAARRLDGGRQFFTRAIDFGFSKDYLETLNIWDRRQVVADMVRVIRTFRPDVLVTCFSLQPGNTHGHHTASAVLALEAFRLAGKATAFPEQLDTLRPWQPKRIVWNGGNRGTDPGALHMEIEGKDPVTGLSFGELAGRSRAMHKTQGFGNFGGGGGGRNSTQSFQLLDGEPATQDLMDGIVTTWNRVPGGAEIGVMAGKIITNFNIQSPVASVPALLKLHRTLADLKSTDPLVVEKRALLDRIIQSCLGLSAATVIPQAEAVPGETLHLHHTVTATSDMPVRWLGARYPTPIGDSRITATVNLTPNQTASRDEAITLPADTPLSQPYWLRSEGTPGMFHVDDPALIGRPENPPVLPLEQVFEVGGETLSIPDEPVQVTSDFRPENVRRLQVIPPASLHFSTPVELFKSGETRPVEVVVTANRAGAAGTLKIETPANWKVEPDQQDFALAAAGDRQTVKFTVTAPAEDTVGKLVAAATIGGVRYANDRVEIAYRHIPFQLLQPVASLKAVSLDLKIRGHAVGYLPGAGDSVADNLKQMGYAVTILTDADLTPEKLRDLDAVVIGVRAFNVRTNLTPQLPALFDYVKSGGTVVAQYNRPDGLKAAPLAPYDLKLSGQRVTDETAAMTLLAPEHPVLNTPNKITAADFAGWVQERGIYFPTQWDEHFTPILACHDPGEDPLKGALLAAKYGNGYYVYTGLVFFRQLPAGVPGAYRLFANLVSLGK